MKRYEGAPRWIPLLGLALALAACGDSTEAVPDYDPGRTLDRLDEVLAPLDPYEDAALATSLAVATIEAYGSAFLADALAPEQELGETLRELGRAVRDGRATPASDGQLAALTLPSAIAGRTLIWDPVEGYVVDPLRNDAPVNGVRFVVYRMDSYSGYPLEPLSEIGYLDITDEDGARSERVGVRVVRAGGAGVVADYYIDLSGSGDANEGSLTLRMSGLVGGGTGGLDVDVTQRYSWSLSQDRDELLLDYLFHTGQRSVEMEGLATSRFEAASWDRVDLGLAFPGDAPLVEIDVRVRSDNSLDGVIRSDRREAILIDGTDGSPRFRRPDGRALTQTDIYALEEIWIGVNDLILYTEWQLVAAELLWLPG